MTQSLPTDLIEGTAYTNVTAQMEALIRHWEEAEDLRCIFLDCYCTMTGNMFKGLEEERFHDQKWVTELLHRFADYYFEALAAYEQSERQPPAVWRLTHDVARRKEISALQHLLLGVNAHINYDLAFALRDLLQDEWEQLTPEAIQRRYEDHLLVNQIIAETIDKVQDEVVERYAPSLDVVDRLLGRMDEWMTAHVIKEWRDDVWKSAVALLEAKSQEEAERVRAGLEERTLLLARIFLVAQV